MKILLAAPRGFCAGVNMAIESLDLAIQAFGTPIYVFHEIVHNKYVVETFRAKGAVFVDELSEVPTGATLLFSAHGVSPEIRRLARERKMAVYLMGTILSGSARSRWARFCVLTLC